jgi:hypothetical protein
MVAAVDQLITHAGIAHFAEGDFDGGRGHRLSSNLKCTQECTQIWFLRFSSLKAESLKTS